MFFTAKSLQETNQFLFVDFGTLKFIKGRWVASRTSGRLSWRLKISWQRLNWRSLRKAVLATSWGSVRYSSVAKSWTKCYLGSVFAMMRKWRSSILEVLVLGLLVRSLDWLRVYGVDVHMKEKLLILRISVIGTLRVSRRSLTRKYCKFSEMLTVMMTMKTTMIGWSWHCFCSWRWCYWVRKAWPLHPTSICRWWMIWITSTLIHGVQHRTKLLWDRCTALFTIEVHVQLTSPRHTVCVGSR